MNVGMRPGIVAAGDRLQEIATDDGPGRRRALFLDRDGVININLGYVHTPGQTRWVPGIFELARAAHRAGYLLIVATNQAGIARGYYSEDDFIAYTRWLHGEFEQRGVPLCATYYCPHHPTAGIGPLRTACGCRKPGTGLLLQAADDWRIDLSASLLVGDSLSDLQAAADAKVPVAVLCPGGDLRPALDVLARLSGQLDGSAA